MLLFEFTINGELNRLSREGIRLTHWWKNKLLSFSSPQYQLQYDQGGYCRLGWGDFKVAKNLFAAADWPPPINGVVAAKYTATTEEAAETLFTGMAHVKAISREGVLYGIFGDDEAVDLLTEGTNYDGDTVPLPRAFGAVTYVNPVQLANAGGGNQRWDLGHIQGTEHVDWHCFDDGVDICANVENVAANVFELNTVPVGEVTLSGTGEDTTVKDIMEWACGASYLNYTFDHANDRPTSPNVAKWADKQAVMVDFLSLMCAGFTHLFYRKSGTLHLVDMFLDNGARTLTEIKYYPSKYKYRTPISEINASWQVGEAGSWSQPGGGAAAAVYVKRTDKETTRSSAYPYGNEMDIVPMTDVRADIDTALDNIMTVLHKPKSSPLAIPFIGNLPVPGEKFNYPDTSLGHDTDLGIWARTIVFAFDNEEIRIEGEGTIAAIAAGALLMEDGAYLLLESGGKILLEA
ncbi:hypothetical protein LCGC14_1544230 [marine sediment metagenome]|uniref:Tip attachment protein J domain-containing protein n=1 Tax=marine sediment metagenome TaxID=412755 RepID=A0A0F9LSX4_9ZZZZ